MLTLEAPVTETQPPRSTYTALKRLHRASVLELARKLYICHVAGWPVLERATSSDTRGETGENPLTGNFRPGGYFKARLLKDNSLQGMMILESAYFAAEQSLTPAQRGDVRQYYWRPVSKHDVCPDLEWSGYGDGFRAFERLLELLV